MIGASRAEDILTEENRAALREAVYKIACVGKAHLDHARDLQASAATRPPAESLPALLPAVRAVRACANARRTPLCPVQVICRRFLTRLEARNFDLLDPSMIAHDRTGPLRLHAALLWTRLVKKRIT